MEKTDCYIFAFATFGHPNDFRQTPFKYSNPDVAQQIKVFDLSNAIKVFPNSKIYSIRKEKIGSSHLISYSIYSFAQEQASKRDGTFIGSSIILENKLTEEKYVISCLNEFHQKLTENNLENGVLKVNHSRDFIPVATLKDFDKITNPQIEVKDLDFTATNNNLVVYCETSPHKLEAFYKKSIDLLNIYDVIYFTDSEDVAKFVAQKGIFKLIQNVGDKRDFEQETANLIEERKRKREQSISAFEKEVQGLNDDKDRTLQSFKAELEKIERTHLENEKKLKASKEDVTKIVQFYDDFLNKAKELINQLKHNHAKLEDIKQIYNGNKILFNNGIGELKRPNYITSIPKPKPKGNLTVENHHQAAEQKSGQKKNELDNNEGNGYKINTSKVAAVILGILLVFTWVYFLCFKTDEKPEPVQHQEQEIINPAKPVQSQPSDTVLKDLNPKPSSELNANDYRIVAKKLTRHLKIGDVVKVIFNENPTDIQSHYKGQEDLYSKHLYKLNAHCFKEKDGVLYYSKDTLRHIPSYKKSL